MQWGKHEETRESNLDRVKKIVPCPKRAREHSATSHGGVIYLASGYEERIGEVFESRVTRWNPRKDVRVHKVHVRASWARGWACTGVRNARAGPQAEARGAGDRAGARLGAAAGVCGWPRERTDGRHYSPESTIFTQNE
ncbi:hypothetical protein CRG98_012041 [Punica granatum]|uniref:Uncharacterized protein n=1 Tax=Punica granatum TaxID=22663 RepID=A0A2I0KG36_PUNGR|nr:hypothetical protein CRG98_012041 [Punica granatum]